MTIPQNTLTNINRHVELSLGIHQAYARIGIRTEQSELEEQVKHIAKMHLTPVENSNTSELNNQISKMESRNNNLKLLIALLSFSSIALVLKCRMLACAVLIVSVWLTTIMDRFI